MPYLSTASLSLIQPLHFISMLCDPTFSAEIIDVGREQGYRCELQAQKTRVWSVLEVTLLREPSDQGDW